jgi:hypothetical protein
VFPTQGGPTVWTARFPDFSPFDFYLCDTWSLLFMLQKSMTYSTCNEYRTDSWRFVWHVELSSESGSHC